TGSLVVGEGRRDHGHVAAAEHAAHADRAVTGPRVAVEGRVRDRDRRGPAGQDAADTLAVLAVLADVVDQVRVHQRDGTVDEDRTDRGRAVVGARERLQDRHVV